MSDNAIEAKDLCVSFGNKRVLNKLSLNVERGTVCALLGPNGAGKTTLIKTLVNIHKRDAGTASILGIPVEKLVAKDFMRIGFVSESQQMPLSMTVRGFLKFCSSLYPKWDENWAEQRLEQFDLKGSINSKLSELSRGMRVRAAIISSLAYRPELLVLDEPFSGLDPVGRDDFISAIIQLASEVQATTLISSHDLHEVERIADSIAVLSHGMILEHSSLDSLVGRFKLVTLEFSSSQTVPRSRPSNWLQPVQEDRFLRFVHKNFNAADLDAEISKLPGEIAVSNVEEMPLKDIYKALISTGRLS